MCPNWYFTSPKQRPTAVSFAWMQFFPHPQCVGSELSVDPLQVTFVMVLRCHAQVLMLAPSIWPILLIAVVFGLNWKCVDQIFKRLFRWSTAGLCVHFSPFLVFLSFFLTIFSLNNQFAFWPPNGFLKPFSPLCILMLFGVLVFSSYFRWYQ